MAEQEQKRAEQHTPGPWITVGAVGGVDVETLGGLTICLPLNADGAFEANARLIAAAPELLEALLALDKLYVRAWDEVSGGLWFSPDSVTAFEDAHAQARAAIAKAAGSGA